jgi:hypothetical protein
MSILARSLYYIAEVLGILWRYPITAAGMVPLCLALVVVMVGTDDVISILLCSILVVSPLCPITKFGGPPRPPGPDLTSLWTDLSNSLSTERRNFEALLNETVECSQLALDIEKVMIPASDLVTLVRVSNLHNREVIADSLREFVIDAHKASRRVMHFSVRVEGVVDKYVYLSSGLRWPLTRDHSIITINDDALHRIEATNLQSSELSLRRVWSSYHSEVATRQVIRPFVHAMNALSANMQRLLTDVEMTISDLNKLEDHLMSIHELVSREDVSISMAKSELLAQLWTVLGGNRDELKGMDEHLALLKDLRGYRVRALTHVVAALQVLHRTAETVLADDTPPPHVIR